MNINTIKTLAVAASFIAKHQAEIRQVVAAVEVMMMLAHAAQAEGLIDALHGIAEPKP